MQKKIVFLPYDFDTAIGTNNEGALQFSYNLEDIDKVGNNTDVYNGQNSVLWQNLRSAFFDELKSMYQQLRSQGKLSYDKVEQMFEEHQAKWPEAVYNEDAWFTYLQPLVDGGDASYLSMLQGSKAEQRKWWLYNRFRYIDSKYNAGDALTDVITLRGYAKSNVSVTPYADIYATVKFGSYLVQQRATRNQTYTLVCPLDNVNDTEIYIYSASQLASVGDLSGLMVGYANFSYATRLQSLKLGDSGNYENDNLLDLYLGNNVLLETLDVRNCINLGGSRNVGGNTVVSQTPTVDLSGCVGLKNVYFDGTSVKGVTLPNGAPVTVLHLPNTITNLDLRNLSSLTDFTCPSLSNVTTLRIENCSSAVDPLAILDDIQTNSRVRIIGFNKTVSAVSDIEDFYDQLDSMRGLDESGNTTDKAQVSGTIHISSMTGAKYTELSQRYPYITLDVTSIESTRTYKTYDGSSVVATVTCLNGVPQSAAPTVPSRSSTAQYAYAPAGWSLNQDSYIADFDPASTTMGDTTVYAAYSRTVRTYTITWVNNGTTIETDTNVPYGATPQYNGATPTKDGQTSTGWNPTPTTVTGNATYTATYLPTYTVTWYNDDRSTVLYSTTVTQGSDAVYVGNEPTSTVDSSYPFNGWDKVTTNVQSNLSVYATYITKQFINPGFDVSDTYAVQWDYSKSDPALARGGLAANFSDPVPATSVSGSGSSPFDTIQPWAGMKIVNILSDGTILNKEDTGFSMTDNDTMVYIPEFWYKCEKNTSNSRWTWAISPTAKTGYEKHPGSGRYISKYHASGDTNAIASKSNVLPLVNVTRTTFRNNGKKKGAGWYMLDLASWAAIQLLYLIEFANFDSQSMLGQGWVTDSIGTMGGTDLATYHTIKIDNEHNQYRWIEDPFSNVNNYIEGLMLNDYTVYIGTNNATMDNTINTHIATNITLNTSGYITGFAYSVEAPWAFIPDTIYPNYIGYVCDYASSNSGLRVGSVGGTYVNAGNRSNGLFRFGVNNRASDTAAYLGSRLIYIPSTN